MRHWHKQQIAQCRMNNLLKNGSIKASEKRLYARPHALCVCVCARASTCLHVCHLMCHEDTHMSNPPGHAQTGCVRCAAPAHP
eukprot:scaffold26149_cov19-Tisochrysis_lutea.AAC.1